MVEVSASPGRGLRRSWRLFSAFRAEQTDPARFYGLLAEDSAQILLRHAPLEGATLLDVGAGPEQFARCFRAHGARYVAVDHDESVASVADGGLVGDAHRLPVATGSVDIAFSSNLVEHVRLPAVVVGELVRVTRPGGIVVISYTNWLSPWGGHEASPWHWFGGRYAVRRYTRTHGHPPKNRLGETIHAVSVAWGMRWALAAPDVVLLEARPRYLPDWCRFLVRVPVVREFLSWNLLLVLRRT